MGMQRACVYRARGRAPRAQQQRTQQGKQSSSKRSSASKNVNAGLQILQDSGDAQAAAQEFSEALRVGDASPAEKGAALYNRACALARLGRLEACADDLREACGTYSIRFDSVLSDDDLQPLRNQGELFEELAREVGRAGQSSESRNSLRAEAREPFRGLKLYLFGALAGGASISSLVLLSKVPASFDGKEGALSLRGLGTNLAINFAGIVGFGLLTQNEIKQQNKSRERVKREDELGRLQAAIVDAPQNAPIELNELRGVRRLLVLSGPREFVDRALQNKQQCESQLERSKVSVIALDSIGGRSSDKASSTSEAARRKGFGNTRTQAESTEAAVANAPPGCDLVPYDNEKWRRWVRRQFQSAGVDPSEGAYFFVGVSGQVTRSAVGEPVYAQLAALPEPGSWQARLGGE